MRGSDGGADIITRKEPPIDWENCPDEYYWEMPVKSGFIEMKFRGSSVLCPVSCHCFSMAGGPNLVSTEKCNFLLEMMMIWPSPVTGMAAGLISHVCSPWWSQLSPASDLPHQLFSDWEAFKDFSWFSLKRFLVSHVTGWRLINIWLSERFWRVIGEAPLTWLLHITTIGGETLL